MKRHSDFQYSDFLWPLAGWLLLAAASLHPVWPNQTAKHIGDFCSHGLYQTFIVLTAILLLWRGLRTPNKLLLWWPGAVGLGTFLCMEALKTATRLPRPNGDPDGFPSGHTMFSFALAWLLTQVLPRWAPLWYAVAVSVGWARMEGLAHFPYQVLSGAALGTLIGWAVSRIRGRRTIAVISSETHERV